MTATNDTEKAQPPILLIADLDGTLHGEEESLRIFNSIWTEKHTSRGSKLVYNTGRTLETSQWLKGLLTPDKLIVADGTEIYDFDPKSESYKIDKTWEATLGEGWDKEYIMKLAEPMTDFSNPEEVDYMKLIYGCKFKHEFLVRTKEDAEAAVEALSKDPNSSGWHLGIRFSAKFAGKWWVTITPKKGGKGRACVYVRNTLGFPPERTVCAGDSGNDRLMFLEALRGEQKAVAVGNSSVELVEYLQDVLKEHEKDAASRLVRAEKTFAAGLMEGIELLGFEFN